MLYILFDTRDTSEIFKPNDLIFVVVTCAVMSASTCQTRRMVDYWARIAAVIGGALRNDGLTQICLEKAAKNSKK